MKVLTTILKVVAILCIVAMLIGLIYGIVYFTNGFTTDFKAFYIKYGNQMIKNDDDIKLYPNYGKFNIYHIFDKKINYNDFNIEVVKNNKNDFSFKVKNQEYRWSGDIDISKMYTLNKTSDGFDLQIDFDIKKHLISLYGQDIEIGSDIDTFNKSYLTLVVSNKNKVVYNLDIFEGKPIEFDKNNIVF